MRNIFFNIDIIGCDEMIGIYGCTLYKSNIKAITIGHIIKKAKVKGKNCYYKERIDDFDAFKLYEIPISDYARDWALYKLAKSYPGGSIRISATASAIEAYDKKDNLIINEFKEYTSILHELENWGHMNNFLGDFYLIYQTNPEFGDNKHFYICVVPVLVKTYTTEGAKVFESAYFD